MRSSLLLSAALVAAFSVPAQAQDDCGTVSITEMNWASAAVVTRVAEFIMTNGYGCEVTVVPSDTVPAVTSLAENNEPDVVTELWVNSTGEVFSRLESEGLVVRAGPVLDPGGVEGWWIPSYLLEEHPELATIEGVLANPELVGGRFNNCPTGWGCRIHNDNLLAALDVESAGLEVFDHGSGETLAASMASAVEAGEPWFGYYWGPTVPLGQYDMTQVSLGEYDEAIHAANGNADNPNPGVTEFPSAPVLTVVTADFAEREPEVFEFLTHMSFSVDTMSSVLAWQDENGASAEEAAVYYLSNNSDEWAGWLNDSARENLGALIQ